MIREKLEARNEQVRKDLERYGKEVLDSEEMRHAFRQSHHHWTTVGEHTMKVAFTSLMISYALRKINIKVNLPAVVVGSLCHDLGLLGRDEKYSSNWECGIEHPKDSVKVAQKIVEDMPEKTEDIIERHMWPVGQIKAPNSIEGAVVSAADKYNTFKDVIKGGEAIVADIKNRINGEE